MASTVSPRFWLYWAVTIPVTAFFVTVWYIWERKQATRYQKEDAELDNEVDKMEKDILLGLKTPQKVVRRAEG
jgi:Flp pilus assembly protein TadB